MTGRRAQDSPDEERKEYYMSRQILAWKEINIVEVEVTATERQLRNGATATTTQTHQECAIIWPRQKGLLWLSLYVALHHPHVPGPPFIRPSSSLVTHPP